VVVAGCIIASIVHILAPSLYNFRSLFGYDIITIEAACIGTGAIVGGSAVSVVFSIGIFIVGFWEFRGPTFEGQGVDLLGGVIDSFSGHIVVFGYLDR
jgi:hypothetical protein